VMCDRPCRIQSFSPFTLKKRRHGLEVEQIGYSLYHKAVRANEERLVDLIAERSLEREEAVFPSLENVRENLRAVLVIRTALGRPLAGIAPLQ
jgi:hypothetical protein